MTMSVRPTVHKARFQGSLAAVEAVAAALPALSFEADEGGYWLWGDALEIGERKSWRQNLSDFSRKANMLIALADPKLTAIHPTGNVKVINGDKCDYVILVEPARIELIGIPVTLSARGGGPLPRPAAERALELSGREARFEKTASMLAGCGEDLRELFKVMELIERAHGGIPKKHRRPEREEFFRRLQVEEAEWEAAHRAARPHRHAEPHEDGGRVVTPRQARYLIQHTLKLWLEREVPI